MNPTETYEVYAIRYGTFAERERRQNFITPPDPHEGGMPIDYFVWAAVSEDQRAAAAAHHRRACGHLL